MPGVATKNPVGDKLAKKGLGKSLDAHRSDETDYGRGGELPAGVNGIAELAEGHLGEFKSGQYKGEPFLYLAGIVVSPETTAKGEPVAGLRTNLTLRLSDDKPGQYAKSFDERVAIMLNELRKLGGEECTAGIKSDKDLEEVVNALVSEKVQFKFHTWQAKPEKSNPNPRVQHVWDGAAKGGAVYEQNGDAGVEDNTTAHSNGEAVATEASAESSANDWEALGQAAQAEDQDAQAQITAAAQELGVDVESLRTWTEAAAAVAEAEAGGGSGGSQGEAATEWKPEKGHVYPFKPKGARKAIDCEVTAVFANTLNLKEQGGEGRSFRGVPWTQNPDTVGGIPVE